MKVPIAECERRDPKGLYKKARAGLIKNFTGGPRCHRYACGCLRSSHQARRGPRGAASSRSRSGRARPNGACLHPAPPHSAAPAHPAPGPPLACAGIDDPYEEPEAAEVVLEAYDGEGQQISPMAQAAKLIAYLEKNGYLSPPGAN